LAPLIRQENHDFSFTLGNFHHFSAFNEIKAEFIERIKTDGLKRAKAHKAFEKNMELNITRTMNAP
jgi:hypothetical protein